MGCLICERIEQIKRGETPYFVCELSTGYVVLGDHQRFQGYTLFLSKQHVTELYHLPWEIRTRHHVSPSAFEPELKLPPWI